MRSCLLTKPPSTQVEEAADPEPEATCQLRFQCPRATVKLQAFNRLGRPQALR
jgi:hypothetical protein